MTAVRQDKIILFGSYAYGQPRANSDVDLMVVMPARNELDQAVRIRLAAQVRLQLAWVSRNIDKRNTSGLFGGGD